MSCVYSLSCKDANIKDLYIGSCKDFKLRQYSHKQDCNCIKRKGYNRKVYKFIRENEGWDNFNMTILEYCKEEQLKELEQKYIEELKPTLNSYDAFSKKTTSDYNKIHNNIKVNCPICNKLHNKQNIKRHLKTIHSVNN